MENSKIAALVELGILCRGEPIEVSGDGAADHGPHVTSGHHQLSRFVNPFYRYPLSGSSEESYTLFPPDVSFGEAMTQTRLIIMLGAADSPEMQSCLESPETIVVVFEPDERVLAAYLQSVRLARLNRPNYFIFTGSPYSFNPALQELLPASLFSQGTPAFFVTDRVRNEYGEWALQVVDYFDTLHYRHVLYPLTGQALGRSRPLRNIHRGILFDQQVHVYQNIREWCMFPDISQLRNRFRNSSSILVAAGPDLPDKFDYIARNRDRAIIISVNNAVKPLVEAGIRPHFVVINDTSIASGEVFRHIPQIPETLLVGHCLSDLGGDRFRQKFLFGNFLPELFGIRENLKFHGSVISTAFALASYLGCSQAVFVGAQLASSDPWTLGYAKGTVKDDPELSRPLLNKYPQFYPVSTPFGEDLYTTPNFKDASLWLAETVRLSGVKCYNTSKSSILYGKSIEYAEEPDLPKPLAPPSMKGLYGLRTQRCDLAGVRRYLHHEFGFWKSVHQAAKAILKEGGLLFTAKAMALLEQMDKSNVTYLLERYPEFKNLTFYPLVFEGGEESRREGLLYYFGCVQRMSEEMLDCLVRARENL